jgi:hypothetical protein
VGRTIHFGILISQSSQIAHPQSEHSATLGCPHGRPSFENLAAYSISQLGFIRRFTSAIAFLGSVFAGLDRSRCREVAHCDDFPGGTLLGRNPLRPSGNEKRLRCVDRSGIVRSSLPLSVFPDEQSPRFALVISKPPRQKRLCFNRVIDQVRRSKELYFAQFAHRKNRGFVIPLQDDKILVYHRAYSLAQVGGFHSVQPAGVKRP